jgi:hypothetical protein
LVLALGLCFLDYYQDSASTVRCCFAKWASSDELPNCPGPFRLSTCRTNE